MSSRDDSWQPMQQIILTYDGIARFRGNEIIQHIVKNNPSIDITKFSIEDKEQFYQLLGLSVVECCISNESRERAATVCNVLEVPHSSIIDQNEAFPILWTLFESHKILKYATIKRKGTNKMMRRRSFDNKKPGPNDPPAPPPVPGSGASLPPRPAELAEAVEELKNITGMMVSSGYGFGENSTKSTYSWGIYIFTDKSEEQQYKSFKGFPVSYRSLPVPSPLWGKAAGHSKKKSRENDCRTNNTDNGDDFGGNNAV